MIEMVYFPKRFNKGVILEHGNKDGFNYWVLNFGTHPCCYVEIPKGHKYYNVDNDEINVNCHGGLTYSNSYLKSVTGDEPTDRWFIGWDYAHYGDFCGYYVELSTRNQDHIYTTKELVRDCLEVIEQL